MATNQLEEEPNKQNVMALSLAPISCPIGDCKSTKRVSLMLAHYVCDHADGFGMKFNEIYVGKKSSLVFDPKLLTCAKNFCLGALAYGGQAEDKSSRPAARGLSVPNSMLPEHYDQFDAHLPVFIMACRTSCKGLQTPDENESSNNFSDNRKQNLIILWLASLQTAKPIYCTVIVYDHSRTFSRGINMKLLPLNDSQKPKDFIFSDTNSMRLSSDEINILSHNGTSDIQMEIIINEYEQIK